MVIVDLPESDVIIRWPDPRAETARWRCATAMSCLRFSGCFFLERFESATMRQNENESVGSHILWYCIV